MEVLVSSGEYDLYVTGADGADIDFDTDTNTFTMPDQQVWISATSLRKMAWTTGILLDDFDQWDDAVYLYDAEHPTVTPTVVVMDGETALTRDADYILSITNNTGSAARMITATVTVTAVDGSGYVGANTKIFRITPFNIAGCTVGGKLEAYDDGYGPHYPLCENVEVWNGDTQLTLYTDYEIELDPDIDIYSYEVGQQYQATVKGTGDWGGAKTFTFTFVALHHTVVFDANGGAGTIASGTVANDGGYQGKYYLPECTFTAPAGKAFDHWEVNCGEETYELAYDEGKLFFSAPYIWNENDVKEITVTAIWKELPQHTVTVSGLEHGTLMENNVVRSP